MPNETRRGREIMRPMFGQNIIDLGRADEVLPALVSATDFGNVDAAQKAAWRDMQEIMLRMLEIPSLHLRK